MLVYALASFKDRDVDGVLKTAMEILGAEHFKYKLVYGEYDMVARLKAPTPKKMKQLVGVMGSLQGLTLHGTFPVADQTREEDTVANL